MKQSAPGLLAAAAVLSAAALAGCGGNSAGANAGAPDEFRVLTKPPLILPPDYGLRPPRTGEGRAGAADTASQAQAALFGRDVGANASDGERLLVSKAGAEAVDPTIRSQVDLEAADLVRKPDAFTDRVLAFQADGADPLAPKDEETRLSEQEAVRRATGEEPVLIERKSRQKTKLPGL